MIDPAMVKKFYFHISHPTGTDCWIWTGPIRGKGYGVVCAGNKRIAAHRLAYELSSGKAIPSGMLVCHRCDVNLCVNSDHLFLGTVSDNAKDAWEKGRLWINTHDSQVVRCLADSCKRGHPWPENLVTRPDGRHRCALCKKMNDSRRDYRKERQTRQGLAILEQS